MTPTENLQAAVTADDLEGVGHAIADGADLDQRFEACTQQWGWMMASPLGIAVVENHLGIVKTLLEAGAQCEGRFLPHSIVCADDPETLRTLVDAGMSPDSMYLGKTALHWAAEYRRMASLTTLLEKGANPTAPCPDTGMTALWVVVGSEPPLANAGAGQRRHTEQLIQALANAGADLDATVGPAGSVLLKALRELRIGSARGLLQAGADIDVPDEDGITPRRVMEKPAPALEAVVNEYKRGHRAEALAAGCALPARRKGPCL